MMRYRVLAFLVLAALAFSLVPWTSAAAHTPTSGNWRRMWYSNFPGLESDEYFYNYDATEQTLASSKVDWPVTTIYTGNAARWDVLHVFYPYDCNDGMKHSKMYMFCRDGGTAGQWEWCRGSRWPSTGIGVDGYHMRTYAYGGSSQYNPTMGYYVVGTCHMDDITWSGADYGWSNTTAGVVWDRSILNAQNAGRFAFAWSNYYTMYNYEAARWDGNNYWDNDGMADRIQVT
jgi:hypothetical protein